jgi:hypothetical protein
MAVSVLLLSLVELAIENVLVRVTEVERDHDDRMLSVMFGPPSIIGRLR